MAKQLREPAVRYLKLAGDRAFTLDVGAAGRYYEAALELAPTGDPLAAQLELGLGEALLWSGSGEPAADHLARAAALLREAGEGRSAAVAMVRLARARQSISCDALEVDGTYLAAMSLLEQDAPSAELLSVLAEWGRRLFERDQHGAGLEILERVVALSRDMGGPEPALALCLRGAVRADEGDPRFLDDYRRAMAAAEDQGLSVDRARVWLNFAHDVGLTEGPRRSLEEYEGGLSFATQRGLTSLVQLARAVRVEPLVFAGRWEDALSEMDELESLAGGAAGGGSGDGELIDVRLRVLLPLLWLGREDEARRRLEWVQAQACPADVVEASAAVSGAWRRRGSVRACLVPRPNARCRFRRPTGANGCRS